MSSTGRSRSDSFQAIVSRGEDKCGWPARDFRAPPLRSPSGTLRALLRGLLPAARGATSWAQARLRAAEGASTLTRPLATLSAEDVLGIYGAVVDDFAAAEDPISPSGVRSADLLESAVGRQWVSHGGRLKYPEPTANAATLTFGLVCDHPFHNGNKRSALVAMLAHLDRNGLCLQGVSQDLLYDFVLSIADHTVPTWSRFIRKERRRPGRPRTDSEVAAIAHWLRKRVQPIRRGDRPIRYRTLRQILPRFGFELGTIMSGNRVEVLEVIVEPPNLLRRQAREVRRRIGYIGYCDEGTDVSLKDLKNLRRMCGLTEEGGVDSDSFYTGAEVVDAFVNRYRTVLRRLART